MKYDAITLDTNIFSRNGYDLENGLLGQLTQFKSGSVQLILSEIVVRELRRHLIRDGREMRSKLEASLKDVKRARLLSEDTLKKVDDLIATEADAETAAKNRLTKFIEDTGAVIINANHASMDELIKSYFGAFAPFEENGKKKNEFPDAIALLSLETWSGANNKKILAISADTGWENFCNKSKHITAGADLSEALQTLQSQLEEAERIAESFLSAVPSAQKEYLEVRIAEEVADLYGLYAEADSDMHYEEEEVHLELKSFNLIGDNGVYDFNVVQIGANKIVVDLPMFVEAVAEADFSFSIYDSIDKDYVGMGSHTCKTDTDFLCSALVTLEWESTEENPEIEIANVELINTPDSVDFGFIRPDFRDEYYEE